MEKTLQDKQDRLEKQFTQEANQTPAEANDLPFFDPSVLAALKFKQSAERKHWQGVNVTHSGIPGTLN
jgi:hypothetical protein